MKKLSFDRFSRMSFVIMRISKERDIILYIEKGKITYKELLDNILERFGKKEIK